MKIMVRVGSCFSPTGYNAGEENYNECGQGTGLNYCAITGECVRGILY